MSSTFRAGARELADEVARAHDAGPGLPAAEIGVRARRARRRREATVVVASGAALVALVLGGAALLDLRAAVPPADEPTAPGPSTEPSTPSPTPSDSPSPDPTEPAAVVGPDDVGRLLLDPAAVSAAIAGLGDLQPIDAGLEWGLRSDVVVEPSEECRRALTVVAEAPAYYEAHMWASPEGQVVQEVLVLDDAAQAAGELDALAEALATCRDDGPFGGSVPGSSGALYAIADLAAGAGELSSLRVAGTESGEGSENSWLQVDVLVGNAIVRTEVIRFDGAEPPPPATPAEAAALDGLVREALSAV